MTITMPSNEASNQVSNEESSAAARVAGQLSATQAPSSLAGFSCYGVTIAASDIAPDKRLHCTNPNDNPGIIVGFITPGPNSSVDITVPTGAARNIQIFGVVSTNGCPDIQPILNEPGSGRFSGFGSPYLLASTTTDVYADTTVTLKTSYNAATSPQLFKSCDNAGAAGLTAASILSIAAGDNSCAVVNGQAFCWGNNMSGQLGEGSNSSSMIGSPTLVSGLTSGVTSIATGGVNGNACAVVNGAAYCWGDNEYGQLGNGTSGVSVNPTPSQVTSLGSTVSAISVGGGISNASVCALTTGGSVSCWGSNSSDQLGSSTVSTSPSPIPVSGLTGTVKAISVGGSSACAILTGGMVKCWGGDSNGQLGPNGSIGSSSPSPVMALSGGATAISVGWTHACAVVNGSAECWGGNSYGELGNNTTQSYSYSPAIVTGLASGFTTAIAAGNQSSCAVVNGNVWCWGNNQSGQLGNGTMGTQYASSVPVQVTGLAGPAVSVSIGGNGTACAALAAGGMQCWGDNNYGQLGIGTNVVSSNDWEPQFVLNLP